MTRAWRPCAAPLVGAFAAWLAAAAPLAAQSTGSVAGRVSDSTAGAPLHSAQVLLDESLAALTDSGGDYVVRGVSSGWHAVGIRLIGYAATRRDSVLVRAGETTMLDFILEPQAVPLAAVTVQAAPDAVLNPLATATTQHISADDLRHLPVSTLEEAVALSAGAVGESYRGGRFGEQAFIIDGLGLKNQLDASTGTLGIEVPPDILTEASLVTDGFSARYGQAISGMINVVTRDGEDRWHGRAAYESDRGLGRAFDHGLDRVVLEADGPLVGGATLLADVDATGRLDADPVNAPGPTQDRDPRTANPYMLPHSSGEQLNAAAKVTVPFAGRQALRLFALHSIAQQLLFDAAYKYDPAFAPAQRTAGDLLTGSLHLVTPPSAGTSLLADVRFGYFARDFERGMLSAPVTYRFGAFTGESFHFVGEGVARSLDTLGAQASVPGFAVPGYSVNTPWGVPAFFLGGGSNGEIAWNRFREYRTQLDADLGLSHEVDIFFGGELVQQRVETFQRELSYLPAGDSVPAPAASDFTPVTGAAYAESQVRWQDVGVTLGLRLDTFDPHAPLAPGWSRYPARSSLNPRFALSTVLHGATVVASWGRFSQAPDFQYLVDNAFADTMRTGRFRVGNPDLGFEQSSQYEFSVRARPTAGTSLRVNVYVKQLTGLVASVPFGLSPDSSVFGNADRGSVKGLEVLFERELKDWWGVRVATTVQQATATASNAFQRPVVDTLSGDTIYAGQSEFPFDYDQRVGVTVIGQARAPERFGPVVAGVRPFGSWEGAAIARFATGLPYTKTNARGDSLVGPLNGYRLPSQYTVDLLLRRPVTLGGVHGSLYLDVRNLLNTRNLVSVRRDTGEPALSDAAIQAAALAAYQANPQPIPYESARYRGWADTNHDGYVAGQGELLPLYVAAARDFYQPLFAYGPPRLVRLGVELIF